MTEQLLAIIVATKDAMKIYDAAKKYTPTIEQILILQNALIQTGNGLYIYNFACDIPGADIPLLQDAVLKSGSISTIEMFANHVPGADKKRLMYEVKRLKKEKFTENNIAW